MKNLPPVESKLLVCVGGGRIGSNASLLGRKKGWSVVVIDRDPNCLARGIADEVLDRQTQKVYWKKGEIILAIGDAVDVLLGIVDERIPGKIVPAASGHLLAKISGTYLNWRGFRWIPDGQSAIGLSRMLPPDIVQDLDEANGSIAVSRMPSGRACLDGCEQSIKCPITGDSMLAPMHDIIRNAISGRADREIVARTSWFGKYGALGGSSIKGTLEVLQDTQEGEILAIATACRCHGLINLLRTFKKP